jgi:ribosome-associated translation inhibitor RaiA
MSQNSNFLKNTLDLIETDLEVKSYIYQQILEFNQFVTPETLVMVIARDPLTAYAKMEPSEGEPQSSEEEDENIAYEMEEEKAVSEGYKHRIAILLKDGESSIEAEAFNDDIFEAILLAKEKLIQRLIEIQEEVESPQDRIKAIKEASDNSQIH